MSAEEPTTAEAPVNSENTAAEQPAQEQPQEQPAQVQQQQAPGQDQPAADNTAADGADAAATGEDEEAMLAEIAALEKETAGLNEETAEMEKQLEGVDIAARKSAVEAKKKELAEAKRRAQEAEEKLAAQQPEYDRVMANKDLLDRRAACRQEIEATEKQLQQQQDENRSLEAELERVQATYKDMRDRRAAFVQHATEALDAIKEQVAAKIRDTIDSEDVTSLDAFELLELLADLVRARERELINNQSLLRELRCSIELKRETAAKLEEDGNRAVAEKRRERAETIKRLIYGFQEERNSLQADIEEIRRLNAEQSANLRRGHVTKPRRDPDAFAPTREQLSPSGRRKPTRRLTQPKSPLEPSDAERLIMEKNAEVERELNETLNKVAAAQHQKTALAKEQKAVKLQIANERSDAESRLRQLEAQVVAEVERVRKLNQENARLADAVQHLTDIVRGAKQQVERIRGHTAPLPIEED